MKGLVIVSFLIAAFSLNAQQKNTLLDATFWKSAPTVDAVQAQIEKGNSATEFNAGAFDATTLAINNDAPLETIKFLLSIEGNSVNKITHDSRIYLHWAASKGNLELVKYLLAKGSDTNTSDSNGSTPIVFAANGGMTNPAIYDAFFKTGISPKKKYKDGANLLLLAIANDKDQALTNYFLTKGMSIKDVDANGSTAFDYASRTGNIELLKTLLSKGVKPTNNALIIASQGARRSANNLELYKYLVEDVKLDPLAVSSEGQNVLHSIVRKDNQGEIINYFLSKGVDVNKTDSEGNTPLMNAAAGKNADVVALLLPKTKNIDVQNQRGESALTMAIKSGTSEIAGLLFKNGANVKILDKDQNNLAYYLVQSYRTPRGPSAGQDEFGAKMLLLQENGLDLATAQHDGSTLYHLAIAKNDVELLKKLTPLKIDINAQNNEGMTALHKAAMLSKDDNLLKFLISAGAKKEIKTEFDETAYTLASENEFIAANKISIDFLKS